MKWQIAAILIRTSVGLGQALVLDALFRKHRFEIVLRNWALYWLAQGAYLIAGLSLGRGTDTQPALAAVAVVQPALLALAALSVRGWGKESRGALRKGAAAIGGIAAAGAFVLVLIAPAPAFERILQFSSLAGCAAAAWFAIAYARAAHPVGGASGRLTVLFSAGYALYLLLTALAAPEEGSLAVAGAVLSFGIFVGLVLGVVDRLEGSAERALAVVRMVPDGIFVADAAGRFVETNEAFCRQMGATREQILRTTLVDLFGQHVSAPVIPGRTAQISRFGRPVEVSASAVELQGRPALIGIAHGISERASAEEDHQRLAAIVTSSDDAIVSKTVDGIVTSWNAAAERLFGYTAEEMIGNPIARLLPEGRKDEMVVILGRIRQGESVVHHETERVTKDGSRLRVSLSVSPIRDVLGNVVGASKIARDITQQKLLEENLRQSRKMEAVGLLAGGIAHDFNNLLTVINGYAALIEKQLDASDPLRKHAASIYDAGTRAAALTQHLLAFSRRQLLQPQVLDLNAVIGGAHSLLQRLIRENIEFSLQMEPQLRPVEADPNHLLQVLINLVVNASDAMPTGGKLVIETTNAILDGEYCRRRTDVPAGLYTMIAVSDTGNGIEPSIRARIFDPFFTTKPQGKGTGLGLATAYGIVKQSGGHISCYSEVGLGTTFRVYLPVTAAPVAPDVDLPEPAAVNGRETILLVEDDPALRQYAALVLRGCGYNVYEAGDGEQGLITGKQRRGEIDLLITDVVMPNMGGRNLADALRPIATQMRVLYISGYTENAIVHLGILEPGLLYLPKPFTPDQLARKVREVLAAEHSARSVLVVDDDPDVTKILEAGLTQAGYRVEVTVKRQ